MTDAHALADLPARTDRPAERLKADIAALHDALADFQHALFGVNDETWVDAFRVPVQHGFDLVALHSERATATIADDVANLRSFFVRHRIPREDTELGPLASLKRLRSARGTVLAEIDAVLVAAEGIGLRPRNVPFQSSLSTAFGGDSVAGLLLGMERRLSQVEKALEDLRLESAGTFGHNPLQVKLVNFFVSNVAVEVASAKIAATGHKVADFAGMMRAVEAMTELTRNFIATVRAAREKLTQSLLAAAEAFRPLIRRVANGLKAIVHRLRRGYVTAHRDKSTDSLLKVIRRVFGCSDDLAHEILRRGEVRHYSASSVIAKQGDVVSALFLIISGRAQALVRSLDDASVLLHEYRADDLFGFVGADATTTFDADVIAAEHVEAFILEGAELSALTEQHNTIGLALLKLMVDRLQKTSARMYEHSALSAVGRIHAELLRQARDGRDWTIQPVPTITDLALSASTSRETARRVIHALERRKIIRVDKQKLVLVAPDRLEELVE